MKKINLYGVAGVLFYLVGVLFWVLIVWATWSHFHHKPVTVPASIATGAEQPQPALPSLNSELRKYLEGKKSPLAEYVDEILAQEHWRRIVAISNIESQFCKRKIDFNCWGIGGDSHYRHYTSYPEAIADANRVMERYKNQSYQEMDGVYVQPYSANWLAVTTRTDAELGEIVARTAR